MNNTETLYFTDIEDFACNVSDKYDALKDELDEVSVIAKYDKAKDIIKELLCIGYDICCIDIHDPGCDGYDDEYIISLFERNIFCKPFKRENDYIDDESVIIYVSNDANSKCLSHLKSDKIYCFEIGKDNVGVDTDTDAEFECSESCENCSMCGVDGHEDDADCTVTIKASIDADEAMKVIDTMEKRIHRMYNMFDDMFMFDNFFRRRRL